MRTVPDPQTGRRPGGKTGDCRALLLTPEDALDPTARPLRALLEACRDDPARFHEAVLGRSLWWKQKEV
jgi:hypothetical protein